MDIEDIQNKIHLKLAEKLLAKLEAEEITAAEMRVALEFLKHNGITSENLADIEEAVTEFDLGDLDGAPINLVPFKHERKAQ